jgi:hypothetical protein
MTTRRNATDNPDANRNSLSANVVNKLSGKASKATLREKRFEIGGLIA